MVFAIAPAAAQWPAAPQQAQSAWPDAQPQQQAPANTPWNDPPPQQQAPQATTSPWNQPQAPMQAPMQAGPSSFGAPQEPPPCVAEFGKLRDAAESRAKAIQAATAGGKKPTAKEACALFQAFTAAEVKMIKYASSNQQTCGIPAQVIDQMKKGNAASSDIRTKVCKAAAAGPAPNAAPTLSDTLSAPIPNRDNIRSGGSTGTFNTLSGSSPVR